MLKSAFLLETRNSFTFDQVDRRIEGRVELHRCGGGVADDHLQTACCGAADVELTGEACGGCWDVEMLGIYHNSADGCL